MDIIAGVKLLLILLLLMRINDLLPNAYVAPTGATYLDWNLVEWASYAQGRCLSLRHILKYGRSRLIILVKNVRQWSENRHCLTVRGWR
jgi:hypothetical protein